MGDQTIERAMTTKTKCACGKEYGEHIQLELLACLMTEHAARLAAEKKLEEIDRVLDEDWIARKELDAMLFGKTLELNKALAKLKAAEAEAASLRERVEAMKCCGNCGHDVSSYKDHRFCGPCEIIWQDGIHEDNWTLKGAKP